MNLSTCGRSLNEVRDALSSSLSVLILPTASPNKERLPTIYGKGPFCHTCQTNQMLLMNLLSNYLPDPDV